MKKVYVSTPLKAEKFSAKLISEVILSQQVFAFVPLQTGVQGRELGAAVNRLMIDNCDELYVFGPAGRGCCWEIGYAVALGKPITFFIDDTNKFLRDEDWMTQLGDVKFIDIEIRKEKA